MKARLILVALGLGLLTIVSFSLEAQERASSQEKDDIITSEQQLARQFADFQDALLKLKQRLARGNADERKRSEVLGKILEECRTLAINQEFTKMLEILRSANLKTTQGVESAQAQSESLTNRLRVILDMLQNSKLDLSDGRKKLEQIIRDLQAAIDQQNQVRALTELQKTKADELQGNQNEATKKTEKIGKDIDKYIGKDGKGGEAADLKGKNKEGKGDGAKGEAKNAGEQKGNEGAKGEARDAGKESKGAKGEAKPGDPKGKEGAKSPEGDPKSGAKAGAKGQEGSPKAGSKANDKAGAKGSEGSAKENKGGDKSAKGQEGGAKDSGNKDPKKGGEQGSAKGNEEKKGPADDKSGSPDSQAKAGGDPMGGGGKKPQANPPSIPKAGDAKAGDSKSGDAKAGAGSGQGEAKPGDSKDGQGAAKDGGGSPSAGGAGSPPPGGQAKDSGGGQSPPPPPGGSKDNDDVAQSGKKIQEAGYDQKIAEDEIKKKNNAAAAKVQGDAIKKMEEAKKKLEKLLQQMREEEIERVLAALQARCEKMLIMQLEVLAGTEDTDKTILKNDDKKPTQANKLSALKLADKEKAIVQEADKCIDILQSEGTAVAFPEVFQQIRQDMMHVQKRLEVADVGSLTQDIEKDIVATLKEMIDALKKCEENQDPSSGKPGQPGKSGKPGDQKLLELLQELKIVRSLQKRVNDRTTDYAKRFPGKEQASDPQIVRELRSLAERQQRIQQIVADIAKGASK